MRKSRKNKLHPFEYAGAYKLYKEERFLLADEMGMFKTAQAIFANSKFREKNKRLRTLIVCPTSVREHWGSELEEWAFPKGNINIIYAGNLLESINYAKDYDWNIISYPLMSVLNKGLVKKLEKKVFHHIILDEVHNAKNPDALRTKAIKKLADKADYLSLLSGTPIPNTMSDLYVLMSLLDPIQYPFNPHSNDDENLRIARQSFIQLYIQRPQAVKELLHKKMLRREISDYLSEHIPKLDIRRVEIPLKGEHLETYQKVLEKDIHVGKKIMDLEKASIDPCLVDSSLPRNKRGKDISQKYDFLDEIVAKEISKKNGKILIFSNLKKGIIDYLTEKYEKFGAINITGDVDCNNGIREKLRQRFQRNPNTKILIATTTMNEGVDLSAATAVINLTIPWTPHEFYQRFKRTQRPGEIEKEKVTVYTPFTTISGSQPSLEQATLNMLDTKENIVKYLLSGMKLSLEELKTFDETRKVPRIVRAITSPNKAIFQYYLRWRGVGTKNAMRKMNRNPEISKYVAELYPEFNMAKNTADIYLPIIKKLEKKRKLEAKIDIACGPGMLGYFLQEPTIGIDISYDMIETGKKLYSDNKLIQGSMADLPLENKISDFVLCSLAYQMVEPKKERAKSLREMSRVLKKGGHVVLTVPGKYMTPMNIKKFAQAAKDYGFKIKEYKRLVGPSKMDYYFLKKIREPKNKLYNLKWKGDPGRK